MHNTVSSCSDVLVVCEIYESNQLPTVFRDPQKVGIVIVSQYSSLMPVHTTHLFQLKYTHPSVYHQFPQGHFTVQTTRHIFSSETLHQNHEQLNEVMKGDGGVVWLIESLFFISRMQSGMIQYMD